MVVGLLILTLGATSASFFGLDFGFPILDLVNVERLMFFFFDFGFLSEVSLVCCSAVVVSLVVSLDALENCGSCLLYTSPSPRD